MAILFVTITTDAHYNDHPISDCSNITTDTKCPEIHWLYTMLFLHPI